MNSERVSSASFNEERKNIKVTSAMKFNFGGREMERTSSEEWTLKEDDEVLEVIQTSPGFRGGENKSVLFFEKQ
jgi:hypothetical protein